jgi:hypothetical protein
MLLAKVPLLGKNYNAPLAMIVVRVCIDIMMYTNNRPIHHAIRFHIKVIRCRTLEGEGTRYELILAETLKITTPLT